MMDKMWSKRPIETDEDSLADRHDDESFIKGSPVKGSVENMQKNSETEYRKDSPSLTTPGSDPDNYFEGDGYSVRRLSLDEVRRAGLEDYEPRIVARQHSTEEFLAFLDTIPTDDDVASAARPSPHANT